jgi:predicted outer membrane repeat protein
VQRRAVSRAGQGIGCLLFLLGFGAAGARGVAHLVRPDGTGDFPTIQAALDGSANGDTVLLANGTFTGAGNRDLDFRGRAIVLASQERSASACVIDVEASPTAPHRGIFCHSAEGPGTAVEDVTITRAYAPVGGAALLLAAGPSFRRVVFAGNSAATAGAVYVLNGSPIFEGCIFRDNIIPMGSGGAFYGKFGGTPRFTGCKFFDNQARYGGGAYFRENSSPIFERCIWTGNHASFGGAIMGVDQTHPRLTDNTFDRNRASDGGAIHLGSAVDAELIRCELSRNEATRGGGLSCWNAVAFLTKCLFTENRAGSRGGGVYADSGTALSLVECTLVTNDADWDAGAVSALHAGVELSRCTLSGNAATETLAAGVSARGASQVTLDATIVAFGRSGRAVHCDGEVQVTVSGCDIFANAGGDYVGCIAGLAGTAGNISADPLFCNLGGREFMLDARSPCATRIEIRHGMIGAWSVGCSTPGDGRAGVADDRSSPQAEIGQFDVGPIRPNPFRTTTIITYAMPERPDPPARLEILDCAGRRVRTLPCAPSVTRGQVAWDGRDAQGRPVAAGVYQARLRVGEHTVATRPVLVIR